MNMKKEVPNLKKLSLVELQELLDRQNSLSRNKRILSLLKDQGESIKFLRNNIQKEIQDRKVLANIEISLASLTLTTNDGDNEHEFLKEKHVEFVCSKEKGVEDKRYKPYKTLVSDQDSPKRPLRSIDLNSALEPKLEYEPTKFIPLVEALTIENEQVHKKMEEKAKKSLGTLVVTFEDETSSEEEGTNLED